MRRAIALVVGLMATAVLAGCQPTPVPTFTVDTAADEPDAVPGDGICATAAGACSLAAAVTESNVAGRADITLPDDLGPFIAAPFTITGRIHLDLGSSAVVRISSRIDVAAGALLWMDGIRTAYGQRYNFPELAISVEGVLVARRVDLIAAFDVPTLHVAPGGTAVLENSHVFGILSRQATVLNEGRLVLLSDTIVGAGGQDVAVRTSGSGVTDVSSTWIEAATAPKLPASPVCGGSALVSHGYNRVTDPTCGLADVTDRDDATSQFGSGNFDVLPTPELGSLAIDVVPVGSNDCGAELVDDEAGNPRPADADGDGIARCDVGAVERQP